MNNDGVEGTVFPVTTLDRDQVRWEDHLRTLTPVTAGASGVLWKREDWFAPLGYGGINGSKLRQLIHLVGEHARAHPEVRGLLTGASVLSPQLSMGTLVARHYGLPTRIVLGATKPGTAIRHENVAIAARAGAEFDYTPVGFNPALQRAVANRAATDAYRDWFWLRYGITTPADADAAQVEAFHAVGAAQAANIPAQVRTVTMTAGSLNTAASVLYGIAQSPPPGLERVALIGIGPDHLPWMYGRLAQIEQLTGTPALSLYTRRHRDHPGYDTGTGPVLLEHVDLHSTGWTSYVQRRRWAQDGITFHPTYEGKALAWLHEQQPAWWAQAAGDVLFWVVGSAPSAAAMNGTLPGP